MMRFIDLKGDNTLEDSDQFVNILERKQIRITFSRWQRMQMLMWAYRIFLSIEFRSRHFCLRHQAACDFKMSAFSTNRPTREQSTKSSLQRLWRADLNHGAPWCMNDFFQDFFFSKTQMRNSTFREIRFNRFLSWNQIQMNIRLNWSSEWDLQAEK